MARIVLEGKGDKKNTPIGRMEVLSADLAFHKSGKMFRKYLYKDMLQKLAEDMHQNVQDSYDNVVVIEGGEGSGKSNLAWQLLNAYSPGFDIERTYVYNMDGIRERFAQADYGGGLFWMDETSQIASNRTWQSQDNQDLVSILETCRSKGFTLVCCVPHATRVDLYLREYRMRYLIRCAPDTFPGEEFGEKDRGYFEVHKRDQNTQHMKHVGYGLFDAMPKEAKPQYEKIKADFQERFRLKIANGNKPEGYKLKYQQSRNEQLQIMLKLHQQKVLPDSEIMDMFGYDNKKTYTNALARANAKAKGDY